MLWQKMLSKFYPIKLRENNIEIIFPRPEIEKILNAEKSVCVRKIPGKRETWRVFNSGNTYYVKIFQNNLLRRITSALGLSKSKKELQAFLRLKGKNILIPELVSFVKEGLIFPKKEYLITKEVKDSQSLRDFFLNDFPLLSRHEQKKIIHDFANFIRIVHDEGIMPLDPNLGNFLIKKDADNYLFYLLDLAEIQLKKSLNSKDRWNNLSMLNLNFLNVNKTLRYYFFKRYCSGLINTKNDMRKAIQNIEFLSQKKAESIRRKRVKRCLENNRFFIKDQFDSFMIYLKRSWKDVSGIEQLLESPDSFLEGKKGIILKNGRTTKCAHIELNGKHLFLKRYNSKGFFYVMKNLFRSSRAKRVWLRSYGFELRKIPIATPIAYIEERRFRILKRSYLISEFITDALALSSIFKSTVNNYREKTKEIMKTVGSEIGKMHELGCIHGDMKWSNILLKEIDGKIKFFFVDLDGSRIKKRLSLSEVIDELSRFYVEMLKYKIDLEAQEAFFRAYLRQNLLSVPYEKLMAMMKNR